LLNADDPRLESVWVKGMQNKKEGKHTKIRCGVFTKNRRNKKSKKYMGTSV